MAKHWTDDQNLVEAISGNLYQALPLLPKRLVRVDALTREYGMPFSHIQIICLLSDGAMSIGEISMSLGIAKPNITPLIDRLIADGFVERRRDVRDRRVVNIVLLPAGEEKLALIRETIVRQVMRWTGTISEKDFFELEHALQVIANVLGSTQI